MHNSLRSTLSPNPYTYKRDNFLHHISAKYTSSQELFMKNAVLSFPSCNYGIKGHKNLYKKNCFITDLKRARNEKNDFFRPYTAPQKEAILLNKHLLKTQNFKEILHDRQLINFKAFDSQDAGIIYDDLNTSLKKNSQNINEIFNSPKNKEHFKPTENSNFINNLEKKEGSDYFVTGIEFRNVPAVKKFPIRPQSSQIRRTKKMKPEKKPIKRKNPLISNSYYDKEKRSFITKKPIETPAILHDIVRKIDTENYGFSRNFKNFNNDPNNLKYQKALRGFQENNEKQFGYLNEKTEINIQKKSNNLFNVCKLLKI